MNRGIDFKIYYQMFCNLANGETGAMDKSEYRKMLVEKLSSDLEKNFLNGHIYKDGIHQIQRMDYIAKLKIEYYPICGDRAEEMYITLLPDCVVINGLYIKY